MENQEVLKAIAVLADKVSRYHERLLATERDNLRLEKELKDHKNGCGCENSSVIRSLTDEEKNISLNVDGNEAESECCSA